MTTLYKIAILLSTGRQYEKSFVSKDERDSMYESLVAKFGDERESLTLEQDIPGKSPVQAAKTIISLRHVISLESLDVSVD